MSESTTGAAVSRRTGTRVHRSEAAWRAIVDDRALTGRGAARVRRVARTLADLDDRAEVEADDVERACLLREDVW